MCASLSALLALDSEISQYVRDAGCVLSLEVVGQLSAVIGLQPLPTSRSPRSRSLCQANKQGDSTIQDNEAVSTSIAIRRSIIVADHTLSIYLDGVALRFSLRPYHSTRETSRACTPRRPKAGLYTEIICR